MGKQISGAIEYLKGKLQNSVGGTTGDRSMQAKGVGNQAKGGAKYETGKAERKAKDLVD
ncbi:MAG TPA: CsbD family protein [Chloroflexota bacterium]|nr:CsbD family protein [Chloroflexota bacterium]